MVAGTCSTLAIQQCLELSGGAFKEDVKVVTTHVILELMPIILSKTIFT